MVERLLRIFSSRLDSILAIAGIVAGIVATFWLRYAAPDYIGVGIMLAVSCAVYLLLLRRRVSSWEMATPQFPLLSSRLLLNILFFALLLYSVIALYLSVDERPLSYFITVALMSTLVTLEIFFTPEKSGRYYAFILVKILLISLILRWSLFYIYPGSFLGTDTWRNAVLYDAISQAGHLVPEMGGYWHWPIHHLMVVTTSQLTGVGSREAMILSLGLFEVVSLIFVFLLARHIFGTKIGLLSVLILGINNLFIRWGWCLVVQTLGIALVALILFLILSPRTHNLVNFKVITIFMLIVLMLTHSVSSFVMLVILLMSYLGYTVYASATKNKLPYANLNTALFFFVALMGYWLYVANVFTQFTWMAAGVGPTMSAVISYAPALEPEVNPMWAEMNKLCSILFYALATIGILSVLNKRNIDLSRFRLVFSGVALVGIVSALFFVVDVELFTGRWFVFMQLLLAIPAAVGLVTIANTMRASWKRLFTSAIIIFLLAFLMISNTTASFDSPIYPSYLKDRSALTESELQAADTIKSVYSDIIVMDGTHALAIVDSPDTLTKHLTYADVQNGFTEVKGLMLLRKHIVDNVFSISSEDIGYRTKFTYDPYQALDSNRFNHVYESGTVGAYLNYKYLSQKSEGGKQPNGEGEEYLEE